MSISSIQGVPNWGDNQEVTRRKEVRYPFSKVVDWDFFTGADGAKKGYLENVSAGGCLLRTNEPIEHRRWIRLVVKDPASSVYFTAVGRICRRDDLLESWEDGSITLHRQGIEFIHALNPVILAAIREDSSPCSDCGKPGAHFQAPDHAEKLYCVLCHLRKACRSLLASEGLDSA